PFSMNIDKSKYQLLFKPIGIRFLSSSEYEIFFDEDFSRVSVQKYSDRSRSSFDIAAGTFPKKYKFGEIVQLPFMNFTIEIRDGNSPDPGSEYYVVFQNFDAIVNSYKNSLSVRPISKGSSVLRLALTGTNKSKIVDFLNATTEILRKTELERKNLYATKTIEFIDNQLENVTRDLKDVQSELNDFRKKSKVFNIETESSELTTKLQESDIRKNQEESKLSYLNSMEQYLRTKTDYTNIAAPSSVGIVEPNIVASVQRITALAIERQNLEYTTREGSIRFKDIDRRIDAEKNVLLETIGITKSTIRSQLSFINRDIGRLESQVSKLPEDQQQLLRIQRKYNLSEETYNVFQAKKGEAAVVKAANVSDINVIDEAKDIGIGLIGPNKSLNYLIALFVGSLIPLVYIFLTVFFDNNIHGPQEIERLTKIPILGSVGRSKVGHNLVVFEKPKSAISEAFRSIRSGLQYIYKKQNIEGTKTVMVTSSVSGEGKTFCSMNIATVFALTDKKTVLVGLDLRKPKIFGDFNLENNIGAVNY
ncbi:MAG: sugar transporter, partial [Flavobacteriaceae bacterium]